MSQQFSRKRSDRQEDEAELLEKIKGLGERSFRKSYYPELQEKLAHLERYKALLDESNDAIFLIETPSGRFLDMSESACRQTGFTKDKCNLMTVYDILGGNTVELNDILSGKIESLILDSWLCKRSGERMPCEVNMRRVRLDNIDYVVAVARDITERKRIEESLKLTQFALDKFSDSAIWLSPDGRVVYVNESVGNRLKYSREELLSMHIWDIDPEYGPDRYAEMLVMLKRQGGSMKFESLHKTHDGNIFPVEVTCSYIRYGDKEFVISIDRDITERKRVEEALRRSEEKYRIVADNTYDWEFWLSPEGKFIYISPSCKRMTGYTASEFIADPERYFKIIYPGDRKLFSDHNNEVFKKKTPGELEFRIIHRDGALRWIHHLCQPVFDGRGGFMGVRGTDRDITDRKLAEDGLKDAKAKAELYLDLMGHDITNMNQALLGYLEMMEVQSESGEIDKGLIDSSIEIINRSSRMINYVKKLTRIQAGKVSLKRVDVCEILFAVKSKYSNIQDRAVTINFCPGRDCMVRAGDMLIDVIENLVDNAIRHSTRPVTIDLAVDRVQIEGHAYNRITVSDTGPGIPDDLKRKIFMSLTETVEKTARRGFGLYLVKSLVDRYHGQVFVEDRVKGDHTKGARFVVMLPAVEQ